MLAVRVCVLLQLPYFMMDAGIVPMLVPPRPWVSVTEGGYLLTPGGGLGRGVCACV